MRIFLHTLSQPKYVLSALSSQMLALASKNKFIHGTNLPFSQRSYDMVKAIGDLTANVS